MLDQSDSEVGFVMMLRLRLNAPKVAVILVIVLLLSVVLRGLLTYSQINYLFRGLILMRREL